MNSYFNLIIFIIITVAYFIFGKKNLSNKDEENEENIMNNNKTNLIYIFLYFIFVVITQMVMNIIYITQICNGSISDNIGAGSLLAFFPWFFIFGSVIVLLILFPGLKNVFSNVIGYLVVSSQANNILTQLLDNPDIEKQINTLQNDKEKIEFQKTVDVILKICSDKSILINEMNPLNFNKMFESLKILFNSSIQPDELQINKEKLKNLVIRKDYVGEFCWYLYTGIFLVSVVSYNTVSRGCTKNIASMKNNYNDYLKQSETLKQNTTTIDNHLYT
jgi:hypothetical protein